MLVDNSGKKVSIRIGAGRRGGEWKNQDALLSLINDYATKSGAEVNDGAKRLFEKAKSKYSAQN